MKLGWTGKLVGYVLALAVVVAVTLVPSPRVLALGPAPKSVAFSDGANYRRNYYVDRSVATGSLLSSSISLPAGYTIATDAPMVADSAGNVYFVLKYDTTKNTVFSYGPDLSLRWSVDFPSATVTALALRDDGILFGITDPGSGKTTGSLLFGINTSNGNMVANYNLNSVTGSVTRARSLSINPVTGDFVVCAFSGQYLNQTSLYVISPSYTLKWSVTRGDSYGPSCVAFDANGNLYYGIYGPAVESRTAAGAVRWSYTLSGPSASTVVTPVLTNDDSKVLCLANKTMYAVDASSGALIWQRSLGSNVINKIFTDNSGYAYVGYTETSDLFYVGKVALTDGTFTKTQVSDKYLEEIEYIKSSTLSKNGYLTVLTYWESYFGDDYFNISGLYLSGAWYQNWITLDAAEGTLRSIYAATLGPDGTVYCLVDRTALVRVGSYPSAPSPGSPTVTNTTATFTWNVAGDASQYKIYNQSNSLIATYDGYTGSHSESGLSPNTTYTRYVEAVNIWGASAKTTLTATTLANVPGAPTASSATSSSITVSWSANGNPAGTTYQLWRNGSNVYTGTATSYTDSGLSSGTAYTYQVRASNSAGVWTNYAQSTLYTVPATPAAPTVQASGPLSWSQTAGRGYVVLSWAPVTGATGYKVWVWDGNAYRKFDVGNTTTWDSRAAKIYPSEATLDSYGDNTQSGDLFNHVNGGEDLRDTPNKLYRRTVGTLYDSANNYWFRVSAYNSSGESPESEPATPTLPNRTDSAPPVGQMTIDGGAHHTSALTVTLNLQASDPSVANYTTDTSDDASGVSQVQFSNDNQVWSAWEPYAANKSWTLSPGQGTKTVYGRVKDTAGNISQVFSKEIYLFFDSQAPNVDMRINDGSSLTSKRAVTLNLLASDDFSGTPDLEMRFSNDWDTWSSWEPYKATKDWTLTDGDGPKVVYCQVRDKAGNIGTVYARVTLATHVPSMDPSKVASAVGTSGTVYISGSPVNTCFVNARKVQMTMNPGQTGSVRFSLDGLSWTEPEPALSVKTFSLPDVDGQHTVYVRFDDGQVYMQEFTLDRTPPVIDAQWLGGATVTSNGQATIVLNASDNISRRQDLMYSLDGASWQTFQNLITVNLSGSGYQVVTVYVKDQAGNVASKLLSIYNQ